MEGNPVSLSPKDLEPADLIAIMITIGVIGILAYSVVEYFNMHDLGPDSGERMKVLILAMMNILSMYIGSKLGKKQ